MQTFNFLLPVIAMGLGVYFIINRFRKSARGNKNFKVFQNRMDNQGFIKRIVVYDLFSTWLKTNYSTVDNHWWTVGVWLNYDKRLIALRVDRDSWNEVIIPFDKIQNIRVTEDGITKTSFGAIGYGMFTVGSVTQKEFSKGLQVHIVTGDNISGAQTYTLKLFDPILGHKYKKDSQEYKSITECAQSIADEVNFVINSSFP